MKLSKLLESFVFLLFVTLFSITRTLANEDSSTILETERVASTNSTGLGQLGDNLNVDFHHLFTSFLNSSRSTIPLIVNTGNFSLIQLGLISAFGALVASGAVLIGEGYIFRQHETDLENYKLLQAQHAASMTHPTAHPSTYGTPAPPDSYGTHALSTSYGAPAPPDSYASPSDLNPYSIPFDLNQINSYHHNDIKRRKKRDLPYPVIVKSYERSPDEVQGASSYLQTQQWAPPGASGAGLPVRKQLMRSQLSQLGSLNLRKRPRDPSNYEDTYRGIPLFDEPLYEHKSHHSRKQKRRRKEELLESLGYDFDAVRDSHRRRANFAQISQQDPFK